MSTNDALPKVIEANSFQNKLLDWYHENKRSMPWRDDPTPYHVWISEIMLQQTRVEAARSYYLRFLERLPDVESLSLVDDEELRKLWEGLGYYNRAGNLKKAARLIMSDYSGEIPDTYEELLKLPGIGPYTAGAIASIAFHRAVPAVDGNVMRVISRISGDYRDIMQNSTRKEMEKIVKTLIPPKEVHHFNQALMELGALICIPNGSPKCIECPVQSLCYAYEEGKQVDFPVKKPKKQRMIQEKTVIIFTDEKNRVFLQKRPEKGLLAKLWEFPSVPGSLSEDELSSLLSEKKIAFKHIVKIEDSKHIFSHIEWHMSGFWVLSEGGFSSLESHEESSKLPSKKELLREAVSGYGTEGPQTQRGVWCDLKSLKEDYSIPTAFKTYIRSLEKGRISCEMAGRNQTVCSKK